MTALALTLEGVKNYNVAVREWNDEVIFLRKVVPGGSDRSYGIHVAQLAGLPVEVIERAREILAQLEEGSYDSSGKPRLARSGKKSQEQLSLFAHPETHPAVEELRKLEIDKLTPIDALNKLNDLKKKVEEKGGSKNTDPPRRGNK